MQNIVKINTGGIAAGEPSPLACALSVTARYIKFALAHGHVMLMYIGRIILGTNDRKDIKYLDIFPMINLVVKPD